MAMCGFITALSIRRVLPSNGTISIMVFPGNSVQGRAVHMITAVMGQVTTVEEAAAG